MSERMEHAVRLVAAGMSQSEAARDLGLRQSAVSDVCRRTGLRIGIGRSASPEARAAKRQRQRGPRGPRGPRKEAS